jgi:hypothetical protein
VRAESERRTADARQQIEVERHGSFGTPSSSMTLIALLVEKPRRVGRRRAHVAPQFVVGGRQRLVVRSIAVARRQPSRPTDHTLREPVLG